ncbi:MAG: murein biosynthesis integral membrane protein MurJ [Elusimicrobiota bacterium]
MFSRETTIKHETVVSKATSVSIATLVSRTLGYTRDMLIANYFGATMVADAFFVAYRIPNLLRRLLGEGSLSTSFIPVYTQYLTRKDEKESIRLIKVVFGAFSLLFIVLVVLGIIFAPLIVSLIAPGFRGDPEKFRMTVYLTRIMFPFLMAIGLGAITLGILNSWRMFVVPAIAPVMLSISEILVILFICPFMRLPISGLAVGVLIGGFAQLGFQLIPVLKRTRNLLPVFDFKHPGLKQVGRLMLPAVLGISVMQINSFVDTICATLLETGSVTHLYYGNRLVQLPLALFGTAVATVALPMMSEDAARNKMDNMKDTFSFSIKTVSFLVMPAMVGLILLGNPLIRVLFERGRFITADTKATALILSCYAMGLFFFAGVKIVTSAFYSLQNTRTPVIIASLAMLLNVILNVVVISVDMIRFSLGASGLALATSVSSAFNYLVLTAVFRKKYGPEEATRGLTGSIARHVLAAVIMGIAIFRLMSMTGSLSRYVVLPLMIITGGLIYIMISYALAVPELKQVRNYFKKS